MEAIPSTWVVGAGIIRRHVDEAIATLHPAYFALSMATGIVSVGCHWLGLRELAALLFWLNLVAYVLVWVATLARVFLYPRALLRDLTSHQRGPGFFTVVAATCVLGTQSKQLHHSSTLAFALWLFGLLLWVLCTYSIFVALSIGEKKPSLAEGIHGGWLLAVVATQSICVLGCSVLPERMSDPNAALFFLASFWLCGGMLYIWMISLIFYRYTFFRFLPSDLMPPYWINMGAVAISALAGTALLSAAGGSPLLDSVRPFVKGFTLLYWATATWWIPMLVVLGAWRHGVRRLPFGYDPLYWGLVFPLGMYSVCTFRLMQTFELPFLGWLSRSFIVVALIAWMLTFFGLVGRLLRSLVLALRAFRSSAAPFGSLPRGAPKAVSHPSTGGSP